MNKQTYYVLTYLFLFSGLTFFVGCGESEPPYPPKEISINSIDPPEFSYVDEKGSIKIYFSERPDSFSYSLRFSPESNSRKCFDPFGRSGCFDINTELPEGKMNVIWERDVVNLTFIESEPVLAGRAILSISYSAFSEYNDPKYSLTPSQKLEEKTEYYSYTIGSVTAKVVTTRMNPLTTKDGSTYVRVGQPFKITVTFDKPAPGVQLLGFSWCSSPIGGSFGPFGQVVSCQTMDTEPVYEFEQEGAIATFNFPEGVSELPDKSYESFKFYIVWAGSYSFIENTTRRWWRYKLGHILIW